MPKKKITTENVEQWMGSDCTVEDYQEFIAEIANGIYDAKRYLYEDICDSIDE
jgi:hypothetical protein